VGVGASDRNEVLLTGNKTATAQNEARRDVTIIVTSFNHGSLISPSIITIARNSDENSKIVDYSQQD
jgi:hypothetical protein